MGQINDSDNSSLDEALAQLAQLPLDAIPEPGPLPPNSRLPIGRNPHFTGRHDDFLALAQTLKGDGGQTAVIHQPATISGLGGVGKSQLAAEFAHRYGRYFLGGVYWLSFSDPYSVPAEIAACGQRMGLPGLDGLELAQQVKRVRAAWEEALPRLLIFDNCEDEALLAHYRPPTGGARLLVTSRRGRWSPGLGVAARLLGLLSRAESVLLLQRFWDGLTDSEAAAIADALGDLPLALHLAGSYLAYFEGTVSPADFLAQLQTAGPFHKALEGEIEGHSPTFHERSLAHTFALSFNQVGMADALARRSLAHLACLAPGESVSFELLQTTFAGDEPPTPAAGLMAARQRLVALGLVEPQPARALRLHRLLHHYLRRVISQPEMNPAQTTVEQALNAEAYRLNKAGYPAPLLAWQNHFRHLTDLALPRGDELAAVLANNLGYHLKMAADYSGARPYYEWASTIFTCFNTFPLSAWEFIP